jgi:hypothetical protein
MRTNTLIALLLPMLATSALAQMGPNNFAINGTVQSIDAKSIAVKTAEGTVETLVLAPNLLVAQNQPAKLTDIKPNDFVASAAVRKEDGKLHSTELRIFPEAMRGMGEGQRPMNDERQQTMTNATVTGTAIVGGSNNIKVKFPGGESEMIVDPGVPVIMIVAADRGAVKVGAKVRVQGTKADAAAQVTRITLQ